VKVLSVSSGGEGDQKHGFRGGGGHGRRRRARRSGGEGLRDEVAGVPFYSQGAHSGEASRCAKGGPDRGRRPTRRAARQRVRRECRCGTGRVLTSRHLSARGASGQATSGGCEPQEGVSGGAGRPYGAYSAARCALAFRCRTMRSTPV
jgi:hypothetical protein